MGFRRSEYGRQYREPGWDTYQDYYRQQVLYRAYRRRLESHHNFVEWDWETESESGEVRGDRAADRPEQVQAAGTILEDQWTRPVNEGEAIAARGLSDREVQTPDWGDEKTKKRRRSESTRGNHIHSKLNGNVIEMKIEVCSIKKKMISKKEH